MLPQVKRSTAGPDVPGIRLGPISPTPERSVRHPWRWRYTVGLLTADLVAGLLACAVCVMARPHGNDWIEVLDLRIHYWVLAAVSVPVWIISMAVAGAYRISRAAEGLKDYRVPVVTALRLTAAVAVGSFALKAPLSRGLIVVYFPTLVVVAFLGRWAARQVLTLVRRRGRALHAVVLAGEAESVEKFAQHLSRKPSHGYRVVAVCLPRSEVVSNIPASPFPIAGTPDELLRVASEVGADSVAVVGQGRFVDTTLQQVAWQFERSGIDLLVAPDIVDLAGPRIRVTPLTGLPLLHITEPRVTSVPRTLKSLYERALAVPLLLIAGPFMIAAALAVLLDSGRPVLYHQTRVGHGGRPFRMLKLRTMHPDADIYLDTVLDLNEQDGALFKIRKDPRVTSVGRWLRKHSFDELPQLINVLKGDMVLVGPRPCLEREMAQFSQASYRRFLVKPGLTGLWQVSGRADVPWEEAVRLDLYYVENWSPLMDLQIVYRTILVVVGGRGAY
jgi:exopolysaccharide biosynthesis polyprenyl glycosylphosphotransferase